ncbi:MAG: hypothetical protein KC561_06975, partial [Myxococcales bacterium]|nr:hypothetical protein [Myxococcales bacterium]
SDMQAEAQDAARRLSHGNWDAILIADTGSNATTLAAYLAVENVWARAITSEPRSDRKYVVYLGNSFWHDPQFLNEGPDYLSGAVFPTWLGVVESSPSAARFSDAFERVFDRRPGLAGSFAFDALATLQYLMLDSGIRTRSGIRDALSELDGLEGVTGQVSFGADGTSQQTPMLMTISDGGFAPFPQQ